MIVRVFDACLVVFKGKYFALANNAKYVAIFKNMLPPKESDWILI